MGVFICESCNHLRESREHGFHYTEESGCKQHCYCEDCFSDVLAEVFNGTHAHALTAIDGISLETNHVSFALRCVDVY